jgi:hypothetical protein
MGLGIKKYVMDENLDQSLQRSYGNQKTKEVLNNIM